MQLTTIQRFSEGNTVLLETVGTVDVPGAVPSPPSNIVASGAYTAWPDACPVPGGVLCVYTRGNSHHGDNSGNVYARERGLTWQPETLVCDGAIWTSAMGVSWIDGRAFVSLWRNDVGVPNTGRAGLVTSVDRKTWGAWIDLHGPSGFTRESFTAGPVVKWQGAYYVTVEGTNIGDPQDLNSCRLLKSSDGLVWGNPLQISAAPAFESRLVATPTELLCLHRTADGPSMTTINWSANGMTWPVPVAAFPGHAAPKCIRLDSGRLFTVTRRNADGACVGRFSDDSGRNWGAELVIDAAMFQMEYGCPVQIPGALLVQYGAQPTSAITSCSIKEAIVQEPAGPVPPPTPPAGTWNLADKHSAVALSGANLVATTSGGSLGSVRSTRSHSSGHWQAEVNVTGDPNFMVGLARNLASLGIYPGGDVNGWGYYGWNGFKYNGVGSAYAASGGGSVIGIDYQDGVIRFARDGVDLGVAFTVPVGIELFVMWGPGTSGPGVRSAAANFDGPFAYPKAGASPWG